MKTITEFSGTLLREAARQIRVVAILVELALGFGQQRARPLVRLRRQARNACLLGLGQQRARLAQVLRLDRGELRIAEQYFGLVGPAARAANVAVLEAACGRIEALPGLGPEFRGKRRGVRVRRIGARLQNRSERDAGDLGGFSRVGEGFGRGIESALNALDVAPAREIALRRRVRFESTRECGRREQLGIGGPCGLERSIHIGE